MSPAITGGIIVACLVVAFLMTLDRRELAFAVLACVIGGVLAYGQPSEAVGLEPAGHSAGNWIYDETPGQAWSIGPIGTHSDELRSRDRCPCST